MKRALAAALVLAVWPQAGMAGPSLCTGSEHVVFACGVKGGRIISVCGAADLHAVQYRFGRAGAVALAYPENAAQAHAVLHYGHYFRYQTDYARMSFTRGTTQYEVFTHYDGSDPRAVVDSAGVTVTDGQGRETIIPCVGTVQNDLPALQAVLTCAPDAFDCPGS